MERFQNQGPSEAQSRLQRLKMTKLERLRNLKKTSNQNTSQGVESLGAEYGGHKQPQSTAQGAQAGHYLEYEHTEPSKFSSASDHLGGLNYHSLSVKPGAEPRKLISAQQRKAPNHSRKARNGGNGRGVHSSKKLKQGNQRPLGGTKARNGVNKTSKRSPDAKFKKTRTGGNVGKSRVSRAGDPKSRKIRKEIDKEDEDDEDFKEFMRKQKEKEQKDSEEINELLSAHDLILGAALANLSYKPEEKAPKRLGRGKKQARNTVGGLNKGKGRRPNNPKKRGFGGAGDAGGRAGGHFGSSGAPNRARKSKMGSIGGGKGNRERAKNARLGAQNMYPGAGNGSKQSRSGQVKSPTRFRSSENRQSQQNATNISATFRSPQPTSNAMRGGYGSEQGQGPTVKRFGGSFAGSGSQVGISSKSRITGLKQPIGRNLNQNKYISKKDRSPERVGGGRKHRSPGMVGNSKKKGFSGISKSRNFMAGKKAAKADRSLRASPLSYKKAMGKAGGSGAARFRSPGAQGPKASPRKSKKRNQKGGSRGAQGGGQGSRIASYKLQMESIANYQSEGNQRAHNPRIAAGETSGGLHSQARNLYANQADEYQINSERGPQEASSISSAREQQNHLNSHLEYANDLEDGYGLAEPSQSAKKVENELSDHKNSRSGFDSSGKKKTAKRVHGYKKESSSLRGNQLTLEKGAFSNPTSLYSFQANKKFGGAGGAKPRKTNPQRQPQRSQVSQKRLRNPTQSSGQIKKPVARNSQQVGQAPKKGSRSPSYAYKGSDYGSLYTGGNGKKKKRLFGQKKQNSQNQPQKPKKQPPASLEDAEEDGMEPEMLGMPEAKLSQQPSPKKAQNSHKKAKPGTAAGGGRNRPGRKRYVGKKTFLGRMEIMSQEIPEIDPSHPIHQQRLLDAAKQNMAKIAHLDEEFNSLAKKKTSKRPKSTKKAEKVDIFSLERELFAEKNNRSTTVYSTKSGKSKAKTTDITDKFLRQPQLFPNLHIVNSNVFFPVIHHSRGTIGDFEGVIGPETDGGLGELDAPDRLSEGSPQQHLDTKRLENLIGKSGGLSKGNSWDELPSIYRNIKGVQSQLRGKKKINIAKKKKKSGGLVISSSRRNQKNSHKRSKIKSYDFGLTLKDNTTPTSHANITRKTAKKATNPTTNTEATKRHSKHKRAKISKLGIKNKSLLKSDDLKKDSGSQNKETFLGITEHQILSTFDRNILEDLDSDENMLLGGRRPSKKTLDKLAVRSLQGGSLMSGKMIKSEGMLLLESLEQAVAGDGVQQDSRLFGASGYHDEEEEEEELNNIKFEVSSLGWDITNIDQTRGFQSELDHGDSIAKFSTTSKNNRKRNKRVKKAAEGSKNTKNARSTHKKTQNSTLHNNSKNIKNGNNRRREALKKRIIVNKKQRGAKRSVDGPSIKNLDSIHEVNSFFINAEPSLKKRTSKGLNRTLDQTDSRTNLGSIKTIRGLRKNRLEASEVSQPHLKPQSQENTLMTSDQKNQKSSYYEQLMKKKRHKANNTNPRAHQKAKKTQKTSKLKLKSRKSKNRQKRKNSMASGIDSSSFSSSIGRGGFGGNFRPEALFSSTLGSAPKMGSFKHCLRTSESEGHSHRIFKSYDNVKKVLDGNPGRKMSKPSFTNFMSMKKENREQRAASPPKHLPEISETDLGSKNPENEAVFEVDLSAFKSTPKPRNEISVDARSLLSASNPPGNLSAKPLQPISEIGPEGQKTQKSAYKSHSGSKKHSQSPLKSLIDPMVSESKRKLFKKDILEIKQKDRIARQARNTDCLSERSGSHSSFSGYPRSSNLPRKSRRSKLPKLSKIYYIDKLIEALSSKNEKDPFYEHFIQSSQSIVYIKSTEKPSEDTLLSKRVYLPPRKPGINKTLIFDLDETLIHCNDSDSDKITQNTENSKNQNSAKNAKNGKIEAQSGCDVRIPIKFTGGEVLDASVVIRPYARKCLQRLSKYFEIVVFTASHACYANMVLNILDPENKFITYRLYREHCAKTREGIFVKDLRIFGNRDLSDMLLIDNAVYSYGYQLYNGVPILPFYRDKRDRQLEELSDFLVRVKDVKDVRDAVRRFFMCELYEKYSMRPEILARMILKQRNKLY